MKLTVFVLVQFPPFESVIISVKLVEPFPFIVVVLFVVFLSTPESEYKVVSPAFNVILTVFITSFFSVSVVISFLLFVVSVYPPVIAFTFIVAFIVFEASKLFIVIVISEPFSTEVPTSKLCFNTIPVSFELSSDVVVLTLNPASAKIFLASSCDFPITSGTAFFSTPVLTCIIKVSPAKASVLGSISWLIT